MTDRGNAPDPSLKPLYAYLTELRRCVLVSLALLLLAVMVAFPFADRVFDFLVAPLNDLWSGQSGRRIIYTALQEKFFVNVKIAFFTGFCVAFPLMVVQLWRFVTPALWRHEKRAIAPFLLAPPLLFAAGAAFVYYLVLPQAWAFFLGFEQSAAVGALPVQLEPKADEYLTLVIRLIVAFGLGFQLPVVLLVLARAGLVTPEGLKRKRRYAIVLAFVAAAVLTPPDPLSQIALAAPLVLLYEASIWGAVLLRRRRPSAAAGENHHQGDG